MDKLDSVSQGHDSGLTMLALLDMLDASTHFWRSDLGHVSDAVVAWQPSEHGHSISSMLLHMADIESFAVDEVVLGTPRSEAVLEMFGAEFVHAKLGEWPPAMEASLEWHFAIQDAIRSVTHVSLSGRNPAEVVDHPKWGALTLGALILRMIHHEAYHAGQLMHQKSQYVWSSMDTALAA